MVDTVGFLGLYGIVVTRNMTSCWQSFILEKQEIDLLKAQTFGFWEEEIYDRHECEILSDVSIFARMSGATMDSPLT